MQQGSEVEENDISLFDLLRIVQGGWRWVAGGAVLGAVGAGLALALLPAKYEAVALVQVGQVGQVGQVEPPLQAIERIRTGSFQIEAAKLAGNQAWQEAVARSPNGGETDFFSLRLVKNTQLIEIRAKSGTRDGAGKIAGAIIDVLAKRHSELAAPILNRLKEELALAKERLRMAHVDMESVGAFAPSAGLKGTHATELALVASVRQYKESELFAQYQIISAALSPPATQPTRAVEPPFAGENPVAPRKGLIAALGPLVGVALGLLAVFVTNASRARSVVPCTEDRKLS